MSRQTSYTLFTLPMTWRRFSQSLFLLAALSLMQKQQCDWQTGGRCTQSICGPALHKLFHTARRGLHLAATDMGAHYKCVSLALKHYEAKNQNKFTKFLWSPGIEWFLCHKKCEALYPTCTHTIESKIASSPVGTAR